MWQAAHLASRRHHSPAHDIFARPRWSADEVGLRLPESAVALIVPPGGTVRALALRAAERDGQTPAEQRGDPLLSAALGRRT